MPEQRRRFMRLSAELEIEYTIITDSFMAQANQLSEKTKSIDLSAGEFV